MNEEYSTISICNLIKNIMDGKIEHLSAEWKCNI